MGILEIRQVKKDVNHVIAMETLIRQLLEIVTEKQAFVFVVLGILPASIVKNAQKIIGVTL